MTINKFLTVLKESINDVLNSEICFIILGIAFIILTSISFYKTIKEYARYKKGEDKNKKEED